MLPGGGRVFHARRVEEQVAGGGNVGRGECVVGQRDGRRRTQLQGRQGGAFVESLGSERGGFGKIDLLELRVFGETEVAYLLDIGKRDALQSVAPANGIHSQIFCGGQVDCRQALAVLEQRRGDRFERAQKRNVITRQAGHSAERPAGEGLKRRKGNGGDERAVVEDGSTDAFHVGEIDRRDIYTTAESSGNYGLDRGHIHFRQTFAFVEREVFHLLEYGHIYVRKSGTFGEHI